LQLFETLKQLSFFALEKLSNPRRNSVTTSIWTRKNNVQSSQETSGSGTNKTGILGNVGLMKHRDRNKTGQIRPVNRICVTTTRKETCRKINSFGSQKGMEETTPRHGCRREDNIKMDLNEMGLESVDWICLAKDRHR
jgi:hypothetical protein